MKNKRGQVWGIDLSIAFILFLGVIFLFYRYSISFTPESSLVNKMIKEGGYASNALLSEGYPENWTLYTLNDIGTLGLLGNDSLLDINKVSNFSAWVGGGPTLKPTNYSLSKPKLNTKYDYYITFKNGTGQADCLLDTVGNCIVLGKDYSNENPKQVVKIQRLVAYDTGQGIKPFKLLLYIWTKEGG